MTAESVLLRRDPLRALGARTKYDAVEIERLVELLSRATADRARGLTCSAPSTRATWSRCRSCRRAKRVPDRSVPPSWPTCWTRPPGRCRT